MPKVTSWGIDDSEPEDIEGGAGGARYSGPVPPAGVYNAVMKIAKMKKNKNGDDMMNFLFEIQDKDYKEFNGYAIWHNQNITKQGSPYIKQMLNAMGAEWKDFLNKTVTEDSEWSKEKPTNITKLAGMKVESLIEVAINTRRDKDLNGNDRLSVFSFLPVQDSSGKGKDDDDEDDDDLF